MCSSVEATGVQYYSYYIVVVFIYYIYKYYIEKRVTEDRSLSS